MHFKGFKYTGFILGFFYVAIPTLFNFSQAFALSNGPAALAQQHFDAAVSPAQWSVTVSSGGNIASVVQVTGQTGSNADSRDTSPGTNGFVSTSSECGACALTLVYTDPAPAGQGIPTYIMVDVNTGSFGQQIGMAVSTSTGMTVQVSTDDILNCPSTIPLGVTTGGSWYTVFMNTTGLGLTGDLISITLIFPDGSQASGVGSGMQVDNVIGTNTWPTTGAGACGSGPPPTAVPTATNTTTPTGTNTSSPTRTNTSTPTFSSTNTSTITFTPTPTFTSTFTVTNTPTSSPTNSPTPTSSFSPTATGLFTSTITNTPLFTFTNTPTNTITVTSTNTATATMTSTPINTFTNTFTTTATNTTTPTNTPTITNTFTSTNTFTATLTPTNTNTAGPTATSTPTACPIVVYPDPMDFQHNPPYNNQCPTANGCIKFGCIPVGSTVTIRTISLDLVRVFPVGDPNFTLQPLTSTELLTWDGNNGDGNPVSEGFYIYVITGPGGRTFGKLAILHSRTGP